MSGRGLGSSGGTLDKMEAIAGWSFEVPMKQFKRQLAEVGFVLAGQTAVLAPADKKIYALRDVTGTVASLPLIAASIMSKKLAAGADAIVLDVKTGSGAFMATVEAATDLAQIMVDIGTDAGRKVVALISDMNQPLGTAVGNALEVKEAIETLRGGGPTIFGNIAAKPLPTCCCWRAKPTRWPPPAPWPTTPAPMGVGWPRSGRWWWRKAAMWRK